MSESWQFHNWGAQRLMATDPNAGRTFRENVDMSNMETQFSGAGMAELAMKFAYIGFANQGVTLQHPPNFYGACDKDIPVTPPPRHNLVSAKPPQANFSLMPS